jgi:membrane-bound lytic murein transglycosylase A
LKQKGQWHEAPDRKAIDEGALNNQGLELVWLESKIDAFFIHIQGSAALSLTDGSEIRVGFNGKSGHAYTSIGKILVDRGSMTLDEVSMTSLRAWLKDNAGQADEIMHNNRSYIFFEERHPENPGDGPVAAANVPLSAGRSLAIDREIYSFGYPFWLDSEKPLPDQDKPLQQLVVAQDTGSAIKGKARGDLFIGSGEEAGNVAGYMAISTHFYLLKPKALPTGHTP